jgi:hypothetical protein
MLTKHIVVVVEQLVDDDGNDTRYLRAYSRSLTVRRCNSETHEVHPSAWRPLALL